MSTALLTMRGIRKRYGATVALDGVDLDVAPGEVVALAGENGAGKSTLMKVLSGAVRPDDGTMTLDGAAYAPRSPRDGRDRGVAMVYQELSLAPHLGAVENIVLGVEPARGPLVRRRAARRMAREALERVGRGDLVRGGAVGRLSVAEQQVIEIARAVASGCRVLVLDEPTSSLGHDDVERLHTLIGELRRDGLAIVVISHILEELQQVADRYVVLRDGATVGGGDMGEAKLDDIVAEMIGRSLETLYPRSPRTAGDVVLEVNDLTGIERPQGATLQLRRGEVLGIAGLVGAGRTELLRVIFGLDAVRRGDVRVAAASGAATPATRWRQGVGMVSEDRATEGLAHGRSIAENITLPTMSMVSTPRSRRRAASRWIDRLGVRCAGAHQDVAALSGGNQQKVALARLLDAEVDVLLLDEPTRGIDIGSKAEIYRLIDALATGREDGRSCAVLVVSSATPELLGICDRIAVMRRGRLGAARAAGELDDHAVLAYATGAST